MTAWADLYGAGSPQYQAQLDAFNAVRDSLMQRYMQQTAAAGLQPGQSPQQFAGQTVPQQQAPPPADLSWRDEDLVGAATFWGIPEEQARAMPKQILVETVNRFRSETRPDMTQLDERLGAIAPTLASLPAQFGLGVAQAITGGLQRLPIIGESLSRIKVLHDTDLWLRQLEEGVRASTPANTQALQTGAEAAGALAAMWHPSVLAWNGAGRIAQALPLVNRLSPILRAGLQGGATVYALEGGSHEFEEHPLLMLGAGVGLGALGVKLQKPLENLITRVQSRFVTPEIVAAAADSPVQAPLMETMLLDEQLARRTALQQMAASGDEQAQAMLTYMDRPPVSAAAPSASDDPLFDEMWAAAKARTSAAGLNPEDSGEVMSFFDPSEYAAAVTKPVPRTFVPVRLVETEVVAAENLAAQMNKVSTIVDSPALPAIAGQAEIDEMAVVRAAMASNPGGSNIIQGISRPQELLSIDGHVAFARRGERLDMIVSDLPIAANTVVEYERFGVYVGQQVVLPNGVEGTIQSLGDDLSAVVKPLYSGSLQTQPINLLSKSVQSPGTMVSEPLWRAFYTYANERTAASARQMAGELSQGKLDELHRTNLMQYLDDFLDQANLTSPANRARVTQYFNETWVSQFKDLAPREAMTQEVASAQIANILNRTPMPPVQRLDDLAAGRGFTAIPNGRGGWEIVDTIGNAGTRTRIQFNSIEAAEAWVRNMSRDLPDITPSSNVPIELQASHPRVATQGPNTNESTPRLMAQSLRELTEPEPMTGGVLTGRVEGPGTMAPSDGIVATGGGSAAGIGQSGAPPLVPPAELDAAAGNVGRLRNLWTDGFMRWQPQRRFWSRIENTLRENGYETGLAGGYDTISNALVRHHNEMHPWFDRLTDITNKVRTAPLSEGTWGRLYEIDDPIERIAAARAAGLTEREVETFAEWETLMKDLFPNTSLDEIRQIPRYFSHIAKRQSDPAFVTRAFDDFPLGETTRPFYEYARTGNLNLREMDPRIVGESYIRALFWQKDMAVPFNKVVQKIQTLAGTEELAPAATLMENWLKIIRYGYNADDDLALDTLHGVMRAVLGPEISRQQSKELFNFGLNTTHAGLLGFRLHVMARDSLQLLFALPRAGDDLARVITRYASNPAERDAIWRDAIETGAVALQAPRMSAPGALQGELESMAGIPVAPGQAGWRLRIAGQVQNAVRDLLPESLRSVRDTKLHPMYFYAKQGELMRALVYTAGKDKATRALRQFRAGGSMDFDELMGASAARTFDKSWQNQFQELVAAGDDDAAAKFLGRQLADATQFKYGQPESPWVAKSLTGRMAMQFGNYSMQYYQYLRESLVNGTVVDKAKFLLTAGVVSAGLEGATRETGWNFRWMNPYFGLGFAGGPWLALTTDVAQGASAAVRELTTGQTPPPNTYSEAQRAFGQTGSILNPVQGLYRTARGIGQAMDSPRPLHAAGRLLTTGEIGPGPDINSELLPQAQAAFQRTLQPMQNPVAFTRQGTTDIPQQSASLDPTAPNWGTAGYQQAPDVIPAPGGQGYGYRANPATAISAETLNLAIAGDQQALGTFSREDQDFLQQLRPVPPQIRQMIWDQYQAAKVVGTMDSRRVPGMSAGGDVTGGGARF